MLKKAVASGIAVVAIVGLVTAPASARHKKMHYKHGQTTGMSMSTSKGGTGAGPSGQPGASVSGSTAGSSGSSGTGSSGATGK